MVRPRRDGMVLALAAAVLFTAWLGARDLWNPNEPTYGRAVAEMSASGNWLLPSVNGIVFAEKPILYYWMALAAAAILGGVNELTLRLPSAIAGVVSVVLIYLLVVPYSGARRARIAAAILGTTYIVFWSARSIQMDLLLAACVLGVVTAVARTLDHGLRPTVGWSLAGLAAGLGFLAKGPVGIVCPALVLIPYLLSRGRLGELFRREVVLFGAAFVVVALPWFAWLAARGETAVLGELLLRQNLSRFVEPWDHQAPWWYYLKYFWLDNVPWAVFLPFAVGLPPLRASDRGLNRLCWIWIAVIVIFFSLSASKRSPYILPAAPAMAVLVAGLVERWLDGGLGRWRWRGCALVFSTLSGLLLGGAVWLVRNGSGLHGGEPAQVAALWMIVACLALGGGAVAVGVAVARRVPAVAPAALLAFVVATYLVGAGFVLPAANEFKSHRAFCEAIRENVEAQSPLAGFALWKWRASYSYYSDRSVAHLDTLEDLAQYWERDGAAFVIVERSRLDEARTVLGSVEPLAEAQVGHNAAYLFGNAVGVSRKTRP